MNLHTNKLLFYFMLALLLSIVTVLANKSLEPVRSPVFSLDILGALTRDETLSLEGTAIDNGVVFESTGFELVSGVSLVTKSGPALRPLASRLPAGAMGEGLTLLCDTSILLALVVGSLTTVQYLSRDTLDLKREIVIAGEVWGLASTPDCSTPDFQKVYSSNGTSYITEYDPTTLGVVNVFDTGISGLNELEVMGDGTLWANVWGSSCILALSPDNLKPVYWVLVDHEKLRDQDEAVGPESLGVSLNGIAYDSTSGRSFISGKNWPYYYHVGLGYALNRESYNVC